MSDSDTKSKASIIVDDSVPLDDMIAILADSPALSTVSRQEISESLTKNGFFNLERNENNQTHIDDLMSKGLTIQHSSHGLSKSANTAPCIACKNTMTLHNPYWCCKKCRRKYAEVSSGRLSKVSSLSWKVKPIYVWKGNVWRCVGWTSGKTALRTLAVCTLAGVSAWIYAITTHSSSEPHFFGLLWGATALLIILPVVVEL